MDFDCICHPLLQQQQQQQMLEGSLCRRQCHQQRFWKACLCTGLTLQFVSPGNNRGAEELAGAARKYTRHISHL